MTRAIALLRAPGNRPSYPARQTSQPIPCRLPRRSFGIALVGLALIGAAIGAQEPNDEPAKSPSTRWESAIAAFEKQDRETPPPRQGIVFVGSSSIRLWDLADAFPGLPTLNRGFGGSEVADSLYFADRIILPYEPRVVVVYAGDNDIAKGKTPAQVTTDYEQLVARIHERLPKTRIVYVAIKPSLKRWALIDEMRTANTAICRLCERDDRLVFVDVDQPMLGRDGTPRAELFQKDGLHLNDAGYALWTSLVKPHLE